MTTAAASRRHLAAEVETSPPEDLRRVVRDGLIVTIGGQLQRVVGVSTALALRWGLDPARLGVYTGLRVYLDQTNRTSLGVGLGAVQEIPILLAAGKHDEARRLAEVANAANTATCAVYAVVLVAMAGIWSQTSHRDPLASEWIVGLFVMAALTLLHRRLTFHVAVLRAHQEFALTTELDVMEGVFSVLVIIPGLWLAGFWGLLLAIALLLGMKLAYLHVRHPMRIGWSWDGRTMFRLACVGLPIFLTTASFGLLSSVDRVLILRGLPEGERALGLYSIALLGSSWTIDTAGRIGLVLYTHFQTTLGRTSDPSRVIRAAARAVESQGPILGSLAALACVMGPVILDRLMPRYRDGLPALRPLLPGMLLLSLCWPARQALITIGRPYRLTLIAVLGIAVAAVSGLVGIERSGIVGVAWGMTIGYAVLFLAMDAVTFVGELGCRGWAVHLGRLGVMLGWPLVGVLLVESLPGELQVRWAGSLVESALLILWLVPGLVFWAWRQGWRRAITTRTMDHHDQEPSRSEDHV